MPVTSLNFTSLATTGGLIPVSGNIYKVKNVAYGHMLDNVHSGALTDGNEVAAWDPYSIPEQLWTFLTYPSSTGETVFTLQVMSTLQSNNTKAVIDGRGGYMRADPANNKLVHGGQPQAWKLIEVAPQITPAVYMMMPFEDVFSGNGTLVATDIKATVTSETDNQLQLRQKSLEEDQFWIFTNAP